MSKVIRLNKYQKRAKKSLVDAITTRFEVEELRQLPIGFKSPTGSGKTIMLLEAVKDLIIKSETSAVKFFITWLAPYSLAEQSLIKFKNADLEVLDLSDLTSDMVESELTNSIGFAGYDKVNKENNILIRGNEFGTSLNDIYEDMEEEGVIRIFIIDEAHIGAANNTTKINAFIEKNADIKLHVSATLTDLKKYSLIEVKHLDVIESGFLKKSVKFNEDFFQKDEEVISDETAILTTALRKLDHLKIVYETNSSDVVNPLMLIQVADGNIDKEALIDKIINLTKIENGFQYPIVPEDIAFYISGEHGIDSEDCKPMGLKRIVVTKTAAVTGWDCPRAQVLLSSRNVKSAVATDQLIGRILRMPHLKHYDENREELNHSYVYCLKSELKEIFSRPEKDFPPKYSYSKNLKLTLRKQVNISIPYVGKLILSDDINLKATRENSGKLLRELIESSLYDFSLNGATSIVSGEVEDIDNSKSINSKDAILSQKLGKAQLISGLKKLKLSEADAGKIAVKLSEIVKLARVNKISSTYSYDSILCNYDLIIKLVQDSIIRKYGKNREKQFLNLMKLKKQKGTKFSPEEEILFDDTFQLDAKSKYKKFAYIPGNPKKINGFEKQVAKLIDEDVSVAFWMKNEDYGKKFFSINYLLKGNVKEFYPDFIVQKTDGSIELVEPKGDHLLTSDEMKAKLNCFKDYENETGIKCYIAIDEPNLKAGATIYNLDDIHEMVHTELRKEEN